MTEWGSVASGGGRQNFRQGCCEVGVGCEWPPRGGRRGGRHAGEAERVAPEREEAEPPPSKSPFSLRWLRCCLSGDEPDCGRGRGGAAHVAPRRAPPAAVSSSRHSWSPSRLGARDPYISVPRGSAGARPPAPTRCGKREMHSAGGTHLLAAAASRRHRLYGRCLH
mgnify:CR=1 FL=1